MKKLSRRERERLRRKEDILAAAEELFARDGYENASMNKIAKKAEFSKRTLYQYFENKSDLYLTIALRLYKLLSKQIQNLNLQQTKKQLNGYQMIEEVFTTYYKFYKNNKSVYRIIYDIEKVKQETDNPKINEFLKILEYLSENLNNLILTGQKDGSISKELDPKSTTVSLILLITGFFNQLSITKHSPIKEIDIEKKDFPVYVLNLLQKILRPV